MSHDLYIMKRVTIFKCQWVTNSERVTVTLHRDVNETQSWRGNESRILCLTELGCLCNSFISRCRVTVTRSEFVTHWHLKIVTRFHNVKFVTHLRMKIVTDFITYISWLIYIWSAAVNSQNVESVTHFILKSLWLIYSWSAWLIHIEMQSSWLGHTQSSWLTS